LRAIEDVVRVRRNIQQRTSENVGQRIGRSLRALIGSRKDDDETNREKE